MGLEILANLKGIVVLTKLMRIMYIYIYIYALFIYSFIIIF